MEAVAPLLVVWEEQEVSMEALVAWMGEILGASEEALVEVEESYLPYYSLLAKRGTLSKNRGYSVFFE
jgi:hypothetical protein